MNEKIVNWIAIGVILGLAGWVHKSEPLTQQQLQASIVVLLVLGIVYRFLALRAARLTVLKRRRVRGKGNKRMKTYATWFVFLTGEIRDRVEAARRAANRLRRRARARGGR